MRVLVTGASGFLGGHCLRRLQHAGGYTLIGTGRDPARAPSGFDFVPVDLSAGPEALSALPPVDAVVHGAALSAPWGPQAAFEAANVHATAALLDWAQHQGVTRFIHISTPALYFAFRDQFDLREDHPQGPPINAYAATKARAERLVTASPLSSIILRPRALYGPGDTALLPRLQRAIAAGPLPLLRGGAAQTNLTHVSDVCGAIQCALERPEVEGTFNIAGGEAVSLRALVVQIADGLALPLRWRAVPTPAVLAAAQALEWWHGLVSPTVEPRFTRYSAGLFAYSLTLNTDRARQGLGWRQEVALEDGIDAALAAVRAATLNGDDHAKP